MISTGLTLSSFFLTLQCIMRNYFDSLVKCKLRKLVSPPLGTTAIVVALTIKLFLHNSLFMTM